MVRLAGVCLAALAMNCSLAYADAFDRVILRLNGHASAVGAYVDQSNMDGLDQGVLAVDTGLFGSVILPLEGGGEIGGRVALDLDYASNFDSFLNDAGSSNVLEEAWIYWDGRLGRIQLGLMDGAADVLGLTPPSVTKSIRVDNAEVFLLGYPCKLFCGSDPQDPGSLFSPNGMQLRSDIHGSDDYLKISYTTPSFHGLRLAVSFAPDGTRDPGQLFGADEFNEQANIWDFGANYVGTLGAIDVAASAGYVTGENVNPTWSFYGDLEEWGAALKLGYREWTLGAAYRQTNVAGGGPVVQGASNVFDDKYTDIWSVGLTYETGPWMFGANYIAATEEILFDNDQEGQGLQFAGGYTFTENFRVTAGYQHFEFDGPNNACVTDNGGFGCDTLDGNIGYLETTFSF
ncbi:MAG: porin [Alphaproteobacteria bacterium]|nr:porin [Alphaproteobacteria bacterium]